MSGEPVALVLAAGFSRRFGSDKRWHDAGGGRPMLFATLDAYARAFDRLAVVIRDDDAHLARRLDECLPAVAQVRTERAALGMGASLADGVGAHGDAGAIFVALADMPLVRADTLMRLRRAIAARIDGAAIVQPTYRGSPGHPVAFTQPLYAELATLSGDEGARAVVARHAGVVERIEIDDPGVIEDFDEPAG